MNTTGSEGRLETALAAAIERAAISGLCRDGQLEIAAQEVRRLQPDVTVEKSFELATRAHQRFHGVSR